MGQFPTLFSLNISIFLGEKMYPAGSHNLDPDQQAPLAFYFFQERTFDDQVTVNASEVGANSEIMSTLVSNRHQFYQSTGTYNNLLNFGGDVPDGTSDGIHDTDLDSNTGLHDHWREYDSWNTTRSSVTSTSHIFT